MATPRLSPLGFFSVDGRTIGDAVPNAARREVKTYPVSLIGLARKHCVIVGGGKVAERKARPLLEAGAHLMIISPVVTAGLSQLAEDTRLEWVERTFQKGDLQDAFLVIGATDNAAINEEIWQEASSCGILVNIVDDPGRCNFITPAIVRRGELSVSISTGGNSPGMAKMLRERLEREIGPEFGELLELLAPLRAIVRERFSSEKERAEVFVRLLQGPALQLLASGKRDLAIESLLDEVGGRGG